MSNQYPINVNASCYRGEVATLHKEIAICGMNKEWEKLLEIVNGNPDLVNSCALKEENIQCTMNTPLHHAALRSAPLEVFEKLLEMGSAKCFKNSAGETAYDIGLKSQLPQDVLKLIEIPKEIKQKENTIKKLEEGLHKVILGRMEDLIKKNNQALPQVAYLFEKGDFYYPIPGMYGGFSVEKDQDRGIQASSWIRICGGSGQRHEIDNEGNVNLAEEGFV